MNHKWPRTGRMPRLTLLLLVCFVTVGLAIPLKATALPALFDAKLYYTGGDLTIDVINYDTKFDDVLQLQSQLGIFDVINGSQVGGKLTFSMEQLAGMGIGVGDELQFALHVKTTGDSFFLGSGDRNVDGISHAYVRPASANKYYVGFEDLRGGGDRDFNDTVLRFSGGMSTVRGEHTALAAPDARLAEVVEPSILLLLIPAVGLLGLKRRTR